jgi:hypothetical protein
MVNCGSSCARDDGPYITMEEALWQGLQEKVGGTRNNTLALTGPTPDLHV